MITVEGAGLLAQILPVGVLVLAVERRMLGPEPFPTTFPAQAWWWLRYLGVGASAGASIVAVMLCVTAVNSNAAMKGDGAVFVTAAATALAFVVAGNVVTLSMRNFSGLRSASSQATAEVGE